MVLRPSKQDVYDQGLKASKRRTSLQLAGSAATRSLASICCFQVGGRFPVGSPYLEMQGQHSFQTQQGWSLSILETVKDSLVFLRSSERARNVLVKTPFCCDDLGNLCEATDEWERALTVYHVTQSHVFLSLGLDEPSSTLTAVQHVKVHERRIVSNRKYYNPTLGSPCLPTDDDFSMRGNVITRCNNLKPWLCSNKPNWKP